MKYGGNIIESFSDTSLDFSDCLLLCENAIGCKNIKFCPKDNGCALNDKMIDRSDVLDDTKDTCFTAYKGSAKGILDIS